MSQYPGQPPQDPYYGGYPPQAPSDPYLGGPPPDPYAPPQDPYGYPPPPPGDPYYGGPPYYPPPPPPRRRRRHHHGGPGTAIVGLVLVGIGIWILFGDRLDIDLDFEHMWPYAAVVLGAFMVLASVIPGRSDEG